MRDVQFVVSRHFLDWLDSQPLSLAFSTYDSAKLFMIGLKPDGRLGVFERTFPRCMGLWSDGQTVWVSSSHQLWRLENVLAEGEMEDSFDRLFVPRMGYVTGDLDIHDVAVDGDRQPVFVSTAFNCVATPSPTASFKPVWMPPFISKLAGEDRCHLNGLAMRDGALAHVTILARTDVTDGWRNRRQDGGSVLSVPDGDVLAEGLSMPHSPRWYRDRLWLLDSGNGYFGYVDPASGNFERVTFCPGYARGLAFAGNYAVVGVSRPRDQATFTGLALEEELARRNGDAETGLLVIDLDTGDIVHWLKIDGPVDELYDVVVLPGVRRPKLLGFKTDEIRYLVNVEGESTLWRGVPVSDNPRQNPEPD